MYDYANPYNLPYQGTWKPENKPNFLGSDFNYLKGVLRAQMAGDPNNARYRSTFERQLNKSTNKAIKGINEGLASSGFRGMGANLIGDVYETEAMAKQGFEDQLMQKDMAYKQNAIAQLLGLNQFEGNQNFNVFQSDRQNDQFQKSLDQRMKMFQEQMRFQRESQPSWWEEILGGIIGGASQVGSAALLASDIRFKENIKKVGKKDDIEIVEFNYKNNPKRYRGVIAQQIEGNHPEAVTTLGGYKYVDYSKIGLSMEEI